MKEVFVRLTVSHKKNNTSDARDRDLLVRPKKQTDSRAVMGR